MTVDIAVRPSMARGTARPEVDRASVLEAWDDAILSRFAEIRKAPSPEHVPCTLRIGSGCLRWLDETIAMLPRGEELSGDDELWALRSAAIEVAARSYTEGARAKRRGAMAHHRALAPIRRVPATTGDTAGNLEVVACALSRDVLSALDEFAGVDDRLGGQQIAGEHLAAARSVVVESAVTAWLMLRSHPAIGSEHGRRGWWATLRHLLSR